MQVRADIRELLERELTQDEINSIALGCIALGNTELLSALIQHKNLNVNLVINETTLLREAVLANNFEIIRVLIKAGLNLKVSDDPKENETFFEMLVRNNFLNEAKMLLDSENGRDYAYSLGANTIKLNDGETFNKLMKIGLLRKFDKYGCIIKAIDDDAVDIIKLLPNVQLDTYQLALIIKKNSLKILQYILQSNPNLGQSTIDIHNNAPLVSLAAREGSLAAVQLIHQHCPQAIANANAGEDNVIIAAAYSGKVDLLRWLSDLGLDLNSYDYSIDALGCAMRHGHLLAAKYLYEEKKLPFKDLEKLLDAVISYNHLDILKWLVEIGQVSLNAYLDKILKNAIKYDFTDTLDWLFNEKKIKVDLEIIDLFIQYFNANNFSQASFAKCLPALLSFVKDEKLDDILAERRQINIIVKLRDCISKSFDILSKELSLVLQEELTKLTKETSEVNSRNAVILEDLLQIYCHYEYEYSFLLLITICDKKILIQNDIVILLLKLLKENLNDKPGIYEYFSHNFDKLIKLCFKVNAVQGVLGIFTAIIRGDVDTLKYKLSQQKQSMFGSTVETLFANNATNKFTSKSHFIVGIEKVLTEWYLLKLNKDSNFNENHFTTLSATYLLLDPVNCFNFHYELARNNGQIQEAFETCLTYIEYKNECSELARFEIANLLFTGSDMLDEEDSPLNEYIHNDQQKRWASIIQAYYFIKDCHSPAIIDLKEKMHQILAAKDLIQIKGANAALTEDDWCDEARNAFIYYLSYKQNPDNTAFIKMLKTASKQAALNQHHKSLALEDSEPAPKRRKI